MASGYSDRGTDLDDRFELRDTGDPIYGSDTGYDIAGVDLRQRYLPLTAGSPLGFNVGYAVNGTDFSQIFAGKGTGLQVDAPWNAKEYVCDAVSTSPNVASSARIDFDFLSNGTFTISGSAIQSGTPPSDSGAWLLNGSASDVEVRFTVTGDTAKVTAPSGWVSAATSREVYAVATAGAGDSDITTAYVTVEMRNATTLEVISTSTFIMSLSATGGF